MSQWYPSRVNKNPSRVNANLPFDYDIILEATNPRQVSVMESLNIVCVCKREVTFRKPVHYVTQT